MVDNFKIKDETEPMNITNILDSKDSLNNNIITDFHHIKLFVGSAKSTCHMFTNKFNFFVEGYSGPETGNNETGQIKQTTIR